MLSVIDFALAAPVVVQEHGVHVSVVNAAKDGAATSPLRRDPSDKWLASAADRTNPPPIPRSSDSGHWREQEPRQHNPRPRTYSKDSPEPSNPAPPIDPYANNPPNPSPAPGPGSTSPPPTSHSSVVSTLTHDTPPPDGSLQIASSPDRSPSFGSWLPADSHSGSASSWSSGSEWESWSSSDEHNPSSPDQLSTGESHPPRPGRIDHPPPAPPSKPELSKRPRPPPAAELSDEGSVKKAATMFIAMSKQGFRPRTYGSGAVGAAKGELLGTVDTRVYVSVSPFPLLPTFKRPKSRIF
jgi:hypothetical protein